jgi:predicted ATPase/class 3 adenylate cyclase
MRADLPSGTVTFLFTDVEGSTRLLHELGAESYAAELEEHRRVIREGCAGQGGVEVDTQGDAFFFAFASAPGALEAARTITEGLTAGAIHVRIGLHSGTPHLTSEGYVGEDVHRAARIVSSAHGGQVIVSEATASLLGDAGSLTSLGSHRLKDIPEPVTLFQLGEGAFPPLKTIANTNLPTPASSFLGREKELYQADLLLQGTRLLTVTGPGGAGKTRFSLQLARRAREERFSDYEDGVFACFLASLRDPALVLATIAQTLSVREQPDLTALETLSSHLQDKKLLLLLDNLEHLLGCAGELSQLSRSSPGLTILSTSRELLRLEGERPYDLPPLTEVEGLALFCERAQVAPSQTIRELCARLEGLPLALELAAARLRLLSPEQLLERLSGRLDLLKGTRDADPRQQTLRATIQWSYDLLSPEEQALFVRFSVFAGGCTLEAAVAVCAADLDTLESLLDQSLLRRSDTVLGPRFWMLETIREFAAEQLATEELEHLRNQHLEWFAAETYSREHVAENYEPQALAFLEAEQGNVRGALAWALSSEAAESAHMILVGERFYWITHGLASEGDEWATRVVALPAAPSVLYAWTLACAGEFPRFRGDPRRALPLKERAIEILEQLNLENPDISRRLAAIHSDLSDILAQLGDLDRAAKHAERGLQIRRKLGKPSGIAHALGGVAIVAERRRAPREALRVYEECASILEEAGTPLEAAWALIGVGRARRSLGDLPGATDALVDALRRSIESGDRYDHAHAVAVLGLVAADAGDPAAAVRLLSRATTEAREAGVVLDVAREVEAALARCRETLGDDSYESEYVAGLNAAAEGDS